MRGVTAWKRSYGWSVVYIFKALGNSVWWSIGDCVGYILTKIVCGLYMVVYTYIQGRAVNNREAEHRGRHRKHPDGDAEISFRQNTQRK